MRLNYCSKETIDGISFYFWYGVDISLRTTLVVNKERLDLLAYRYLGNSDSWWIIAEHNKIFLPICEQQYSLEIPIVREIIRK